MPQLWIVAGPNGAGKTTLADCWLSGRIPVISPDAIAALHGVSPIQAGRKAVLEQERLLVANASFALDTTLSGNRELAVMKRAAQAGYKVNLIFVCVENPAFCQTRVHERVASGGHSVPAEDVARRYGRSLSNCRLPRESRFAVLLPAPQPSHPESNLPQAPHPPGRARNTARPTGQSIRT